jgi:type IV secretion system protein VirB2
LIVNLTKKESNHMTNFTSIVNNKSLGIIVLSAIAVILCGVIPLDAMASEGAGTGLAFEGPLSMIRQSMTGPVAFGISIIAIIGAGAGIIFGGADMNGFFRTMIFIVLVLALIVGANNILSTLFGVGAEIGGSGNQSPITVVQEGGQ